MSLSTPSFLHKLLDLDAVLTMNFENDKPLFEGSRANFVLYLLYFLPEAHQLNIMSDNPKSPINPLSKSKAALVKEAKRVEFERLVRERRAAIKCKQIKSDTNASRSRWNSMPGSHPIPSSERSSCSFSRLGFTARGSSTTFDPVRPVWKIQSVEDPHMCNFVRPDSLEYHDKLISAIRTTSQIKQNQTQDRTDNFQYDRELSSLFTHRYIQHSLEVTIFQEASVVPLKQSQPETSSVEPHDPPSHGAHHRSCVGGVNKDWDSLVARQLELENFVDEGFGDAVVYAKNQINFSLTHQQQNPERYEGGGSYSSHKTSPSAGSASPLKLPKRQTSNENTTQCWATPPMLPRRRTSEEAVDRSKLGEVQRQMPGYDLFFQDQQK